MFIIDQERLVNFFVGKVQSMSSFHRLEFYIDGQWVCPVSEMTRDVENPATRQFVAQIALGNAEDTDRAVQAAKTAFPSWSTTSAKERISLFQRLHQAYATHRLRLAFFPVFRRCLGHECKPYLSTA
ncbi:MAG: aldehyde dehydrogenase family protein [Roseovarius sp.]